MMKLKFLTLLVGVIAAATIFANPLVAFAQDQAPQPQPARTRIEFTPEQQTQFEQLQASAIAQIEGILTPEQKTQFTAARESGQGLDTIQGLTDDQKTQIVTVIQQLNVDISKLLTPEQIRQIEQGQSSQQ